MGCACRPRLFLVISLVLNFFHLPRPSGRRFRTLIRHHGHLPSFFPPGRQKSLEGVLTSPRLFGKNYRFSLSPGGASNSDDPAGPPTSAKTPPARDSSAPSCSFQRAFSLPFRPCVSAFQRPNGDNSGLRSPCPPGSIIFFSSASAKPFPLPRRVPGLRNADRSPRPRFLPARSQMVIYFPARCLRRFRFPLIV